MATALPLQLRRHARGPLAVWTAVVAVVLGALFWFVNSPASLPTSEDALEASTPTGLPVYLGVHNPPAGSPDLHLSGVKVRVSADVAVEVTPLLCVDGSIGVTADPAAFCVDLVEPDGRVLTHRDSVVLEVTGEQAGEARIERVRLGFRQGIQWGTRPAGRPARVRLLAR